MKKGEKYINNWNRILLSKIKGLKLSERMITYSKGEGTKETLIVVNVMYLKRWSRDFIFKVSKGEKQHMPIPEKVGSKNATTTSQI